MMNADGTLTSPLGKSDPWSPRQMVYNYDRLGPDERLVMDSFLIALRRAQPFKVPQADAAKGDWPRALRFAFNFRDL